MPKQGSWDEVNAQFVPLEDSRSVFVFGSNLAGRHGKGAALFARLHYGAKYGVGKGMTGRSYAIPTKDGHLKPLPLSWIEEFVKEFLLYAEMASGSTFILTRIGCGLAGYRDEQIAPMFKGSPSNVIIPDEWKQYL